MGQEKGEDNKSPLIYRFWEESKKVANTVIAGIDVSVVSANVLFISSPLQTIINLPDVQWLFHNVNTYFHPEFWAHLNKALLNPATHFLAWQMLTFAVASLDLKFNKRLGDDISLIDIYIAIAKGFATVFTFGFFNLFDDKD